MNREDFDRIVDDEWKNVPERFKKHIENVALLIEDKPSEELRKEEHLPQGTTLLGHYYGVPASARGAGYGVGVTLPDSITLYRLPILGEAKRFQETDASAQDAASYVRRAIRETLWHEIGHYFGLSEEAIDAREAEGTNAFTKEQEEKL